MSYMNSPIKKQKSEILLTQDSDLPIPVGVNASLPQFPASTPPVTPLRNSSSSATLPKSAASEEMFSPTMFGITMTPTTYNFSQLPGIMSSSGTLMDSEGNMIYETMPPVPTSRDWIPSMKNLLPTETADFSCFNDSHMMSPPISRKAVSLPSNLGVGFHSSDGNQNFIPSSNDSLDNIRFANPNPTDELPHGSRLGQVSKQHLMSNKKALADRMKGIKQRRPQQLADPSSYQRVTRLTSKQQQSQPSSSSSSFPSYADTVDEPRSPFRRRAQSGIAMSSSEDYSNANVTHTPVANTEDGKVDSPDLIGDTSNLSGFAAITAAAESVDGGSNGYFKFAETNSSKITISTKFLPSSSSTIVGNRVGGFSPMQSHRSPTHSPTRSPMYTIINSPLDLLGSVAAHHENFPTEDFPFSQISGEAHSLLIYDHQLSNDSNNRLAYRTYSVDNNSSDNLVNIGVQKSNEDLDNALSKLSSIIGADFTTKKDETTVSAKNDSVSSASSTQSTSKSMPLLAPTPSAPDPAPVMKSSLKKTTSEALAKARADQNLLYLSPEVVVNLDKIGTLDKQSNPALVSCKCKKSRCLKMYCDCFRLQQYCRHCTCIDCANVVSQEALRVASIASIVERNPEAFKPRVAEDNNSKAKNHLTGCRCRRSNCLKKYCECFTGNVICYDRCRCFECKNTNSEIFEIGLRLKTGSSNPNLGILNKNRIPTTTAYSNSNSRSPDDDSIIGSRLEDIRAVADVIGSLKGSNRNDEPSADAGAMSEENVSSTTADRGRKLSFHIASTPAAHSSISQQVMLQEERTPMEKNFAPEGSMYRDISTTVSSVTSGSSNMRRATPINLEQKMLQKTINDTEGIEVNESGGDPMSKADNHSDDFSLSVSLKECVEDVEKSSSAFVNSIKL